MLVAGYHEFGASLKMSRFLLPPSGGKLFVHLFILVHIIPPRLEVSWADIAVNGV